MPVKSYQAGDRVGPYGVLLVSRDITTDGRVSPKATFICPLCGALFECDVKTVSKGRKQYCTRCAYQQRSIAAKAISKSSHQKSTLHSPYQAGDTIGPYHLTLIERERDAMGRLTDTGTFVCPQCQAVFDTTITSVRRGQKRFCNQCTSQKRYHEGNYYGPNQDILLVELAQTAQDKDKWECPYCHTYFYASRYLIGNGKITSCGCYRAQCSSERFTKDLTGQTFGRLHVVGIDTEYERRYRNPTKPGSHIWLCQCECGNMAHIRSTQLRTGRTQSCGCLQRERAVEANQKDLTGMKFGHLTAVKDLGINKNSSYSCHQWLCQCTCGNEIICYTNQLMSGKKRYCKDCMEHSLGEDLIMEILDDATIAYEHEWKHPDCHIPESTQLLRFDFKLLDYDILIEYDGRQHFQNKNNFGYQNYYKIREHDMFKDKWCEENGYFLLRIPYLVYGRLLKNPDLLFDWLSGINLPYLPEYDPIPET